MENEKIIKNKNKKLAIIGAGISGLLSAKYALENGFNDISIYETKKSLGGNWNDENSPMWDNLKTNNSKYYMQVSDFVYQETDDPFPVKKDVLNYIERYAKYFNLNKYITFETKVLKISKIKQEGEESNEEESYEIQIKSKNEEPKTITFDNVIVSTGFISIPDYAGFEKFKAPESRCSVEIIHAVDYKNPDKFKDKKVIVIGQGHSSTQIATKVSKCAKELINVFRKTSHVLAKRTFYEKYNKTSPFDIELFKFKIETEEENIRNIDIPALEKNRMWNNKFKNVSFPHFDGKGNKYNEDYNNLPEHLVVENDCELAPTVAVSNGYFKAVNKGRIKAIRSEIEDINGKTVVLKNGESFKDIDYIILGTGYRCTLSFLDEDIKKTINYLPNTKYGPMNTVLDVFHPSLKNLAFVGIHYFPIFGKFELQAKLAIKYFSDRDYFIKTKKELSYSGLSHNKPYGFVEYFNKISMLLDSYPKLDEIKKNDEELYKYIVDGPFIPQIFFLNGEDGKKYADYIKKLNRSLYSDNFLD